MKVSPAYIRDVSEVRHEMASGADVVIVEQSEDYPGELAFFHIEQESFVLRYREYISSFSMLNELFKLDTLLAAFESDGVKAYFLESARVVVDKFNRWSEELVVDGLKLNSSGLFPFQQFVLNREFEERKASRARVSGFFFNFGTGTGKTVLACAGMQELVANRGEVDLVLFFTMRKLKINMAREVERATDLSSVVVDGTKAKRRKVYRLVEDRTCVVLNYEKCHFDAEELRQLVQGKRVLFILDEVQKVVRGENAANQARRGLDALRDSALHSDMWPLSATVIRQSPLRYHNVYELQSNRNPLGTRKDFIARYCEKVSKYRFDNGGVTTNYKWNTVELVEVRHRVSSQTQAVRKTDPGVREYFKGMATEVVYVQLSPEERRLYEAIERDLEECLEEDESYSVAQHYNALRFMSNTPAALRYSESEACQRIVENNESLIDTPSTKFEMILDKIEEIRDGGDQVVVFTQWTYLTMFLLAKEMHRRGIEYVTHYGTGMSDKQAQDAQDRFKSNPDITVFLSSDAGAYGLNFQNARYVINVESPYDPDILTQRNDRIDRADSHLDGLTAYIYVCEGTVEERIWGINEERRRVSAATQGTVETLSRYSAEELAMSERQAMRHLVLRNSSTSRK